MDDIWKGEWTGTKRAVGTGDQRSSIADGQTSRLFGKRETMRYDIYTVLRYAVEPACVTAKRAVGWDCAGSCRRKGPTVGIVAPEGKLEASERM